MKGLFPASISYIKIPCGWVSRAAYQLPEVRSEVELFAAHLLRGLVVDGFAHGAHFLVIRPLEDAVDSEVAELDVALLVEEHSLGVEVSVER